VAPAPFVLYQYISVDSLYIKEAIQVEQNVAPASFVLYSYISVDGLYYIKEAIQVERTVWLLPHLFRIHIFL
jgi:hypothetical protein